MERLNGEGITLIISENQNIYEQFEHSMKKGTSVGGNLRLVYANQENPEKDILSLLSADGKDSEADVLIVEKLSDVSDRDSVIAKAVTVREICGKAGNDNVHIYGYFFLPEDGSDEERETAYGNTYAALQRIEYHMALETSAYDDVILLSGDAQEGQTWFAEAVISLAENRGSGMEQRSLYADWKQIKEDFLSGDAILNGGLVKSTVLPEDSHSYSGLGYAVARMAGGEEAAKTLGNVNEQLFLRTNGKGWLRAGVDEVSSSMIEGEIRKLLEIEQEEELGGFWEKYLLQPLKICSVLENNPVELTREQINMEDTRAYADGFRIGEKVNLGIREITQNLQTVVEKIYSNAKASLEEYGPGIMECLFSGSECEHSISSILNQGFEELEKVRKRKKRRPLQYIVGALSEQMAQERIEDWKNHFKLAVESEIRAKIALHFVSEEGEWDRLLVTPLKRLVESCTAMVKELDKESVVQRPNQETSAPEPEQMQDGAHVVDMGSCEFISSWLKEQNSGQILPAQMLKLKKELIHHLMQQARGKKSDQTVSEIVINAVTDKKVTLADYFTSFTLEHTEEEAQEMFRDFANSCIMHLVDKGKPVLNMDFDSQNRNLWMLLPQKVVKGEYSNRFLQELAKYLDTSYRASYAILASANEDEIVCYQSSVANPLYELSDLPKWEQCYNKRMETETLDWQHYFPLALRHLNKNAVNKKFYEDFFVRTVEFALEEKIIERKVFPGEEKKYLYVMNLLPNSWTNLNISNYKVGDVDGRAKKGEPFFEYLHSMNSFTTDVWQKEIILPGSGVFSKPYDFSEAPYGVDIEDISLRYMKRILQKNIPLFVELRATVGKYRRMKRDIDALWIAPETVVEIPVQSETLEPERTDIAETPETHTTPLKRRKFCKYCRYKLERGTEKYCPKCGRQLQ